MWRENKFRVYSRIEFVDGIGCDSLSVYSTVTIVTRDKTSGKNKSRVRAHRTAVPITVYVYSGCFFLMVVSPLLLCDAPESDIGKGSQRRSCTQVRRLLLMVTDHHDHPT